MTPQEMLAQISDYIEQRAGNIGDIDTFCLMVHGNNRTEGVTFGSYLSLIGMMEDAKFSILKRPRQVPVDA